MSATTTQAAPFIQPRHSSSTATTAAPATSTSSSTTATLPRRPTLSRLALLSRAIGRRACASQAAVPRQLLSTTPGHPPLPGVRSIHRAAPPTRPRTAATSTRSRTLRAHRRPPRPPRHRVAAPQCLPEPTAARPGAWTGSTSAPPRSTSSSPRLAPVAASGPTSLTPASTPRTPSSPVEHRAATTPRPRIPLIGPTAMGTAPMSPERSQAPPGVSRNPRRSSRSRSSTALAAAP